MFKLMKYEFRKQAFSKAIILIILSLLQIYYLYSIFVRDESNIAVSGALLIVFGVIVLFYLVLEGINVYSKDLREKSSYMLFLVPYNSYTILGAKILCTLIQIFVTCIIFIILTYINITLFLEEFSVRGMLSELMGLLFEVNIFSIVDYAMIVFLFLSTISEIIFIFVSAISAITLSSAMLKNIKIRGFISFGLYLIIYISLNYIIQVLIRELYFSSYNVIMIVQTIITFICTGIMFVITGWLLENKVSV